VTRRHSASPGCMVRRGVWGSVVVVVASQRGAVRWPPRGEARPRASPPNFLSPARRPAAGRGAVGRVCPTRHASRPTRHPHRLAASTPAGCAECLAGAPPTQHGCESIERPSCPATACERVWRAAARLSHDAPRRPLLLPLLLAAPRICSYALVLQRRLPLLALVLLLHRSLVQVQCCCGSPPSLPGDGGASRAGRRCAAVRHARRSDSSFWHGRQRRRRSCWAARDAECEAAPDGAAVRRELS
jgi:hypothetical protein